MYAESDIFTTQDFPAAGGPESRSRTWADVEAVSGGPISLYLCIHKSHCILLDHDGANPCYTCIDSSLLSHGERVLVISGAVAEVVRTSKPQGLKDPLFKRPKLRELGALWAKLLAKRAIIRGESHPCQLQHRQGSQLPTDLTYSVANRSHFTSHLPAVNQSFPHIESHAMITYARLERSAWMRCAIRIRGSNSANSA